MCDVCTVYTDDYVKLIENKMSFLVIYQAKYMNDYIICKAIHVLFSQQKIVFAGILK